MFQSEFINELIRLGHDERFDELPALLDKFPLYASGDFMRQSSEFWYAQAARLSINEITGLIKTLTVAERDLSGFQGGSVSPVIWLYKVLKKKSGLELLELDEWVLSHTKNDYLPWGTSNYGAKSLQELKEISKRRSDRKSANLKADEALHIQATIRKAKEASEKLFGAIKRKDCKAILALRRKGADVNIVGPDGCSALKQAEAVGDQRLLEAMNCQLTDLK